MYPHGGDATVNVYCWGISAFGKMHGYNLTCNYNQFRIYL